MHYISMLVGMWWVGGWQIRLANTMISSNLPWTLKSWNRTKKGSLEFDPSRTASSVVTFMWVA